MASQLLSEPVIRAVDASGATVAGAKLWFYLTGTLTPANIYTTSALSTPHPNPVTADSGGLFAPIYLDPAVTYRVQLKTAAGALIEDVDPISFGGASEATLSEVNGGLVAGKFVSPAKLAGWTGVATALGYTPVNKAGDTATDLRLAFGAALFTNSAGYLGAPVNEQDGAYTLVLSDNGKMVRHNSASGHAHTIPPVSAVAWPVGNTAIVFRNIGAGAVTITRGVGVTLRLAGSATSKDMTLSQWGLATALMEASDNWVITGTAVA